MKFPGLRVLDAGADLPLQETNLAEHQGFAKLFDTADRKEGTAAVVARRPPGVRGA